jgi:hypothetical protein
MRFWSWLMPGSTSWSSCVRSCASASTSWRRRPSRGRGATGTPARRSRRSSTACGCGRATRSCSRASRPRPGAIGFSRRNRLLGAGSPTGAGRVRGAADRPASGLSGSGPGLGGVMTRSAARPCFFLTLVRARGDSLARPSWAVGHAQSQHAAGGFVHDSPTSRVAPAAVPSGGRRVGRPHLRQPHTRAYRLNFTTPRQVRPVPCTPQSTRWSPLRHRLSYRS